MSFKSARKCCFAVVTGAVIASNIERTTRVDDSNTIVGFERFGIVSRCDEESAPKMSAAVYTSKNSLYMCKNPDEFARKLAKMQQGGSKNLQIVTDFDFTLTKFHMENGTRAFSCHKCLEEAEGVLNEDYVVRARELAAKYYPLEIQPGLEKKLRIQYMEEWVEKAHDALVSSGLTERDFKKAVQNAITTKNILLRSRCQELFKVAEDRKIPVLVFSAGIANVLEEVLSVGVYNGGVVSPNVRVASNKMRFRDGILDGFEGNVFHVFNKSATSLPLHTPDYKDVVNRRNVLLLGDSLGDLIMSDGLAADEVLRIGFLSDRVERLPTYLNEFDLVILGDPDLGVPLNILEMIVSK